MSDGTRLYRLLLLLYPPAFRRRFGGEMLALFQQRLATQTRFRAWGHVIRDGMRTVPVSWFQALDLAYTMVAAGLVRSEEIESMAGEHTVIIGGGIIGVCSAYYLAKRGHRVTLIERGDIGSGASFGSAGIIAIGHPPMPRPGLVGQALRWMFKSDSPLYVPPRMDPSLIGWLWRFYRSCSRKHESHCMEFLAQLGVQASECFETLIQHEKLDCEFRSPGHPP